MFDNIIEDIRNQQAVLLLGHDFLPGEIGELANLKTLDLSCNGLAELPTAIGELKNLRSLDLSYSRLTILPAIIGALTSLQSTEGYAVVRDSVLNRMSRIVEGFGGISHLFSPIRLLYPSVAQSNRGLPAAARGFRPVLRIVVS
ncbi:MAG: leucine-rich repeat domain-containing protein [Saprospiraceae bacterium]